MGGGCRNVGGFDLDGAVVELLTLILGLYDVLHVFAFVP